MKTFLTLTTIALLSTGAFASGEHCVSRIMATNYNNGFAPGQVSTQCFSSESNFKAQTPDKCKDRK